MAVGALAGIIADLALAVVTIALGAIGSWDSYLQTALLVYGVGLPVSCVAGSVTGGLVGLCLRSLDQRSNAPVVGAVAAAPFPFLIRQIIAVPILNGADFDYSPQAEFLVLSLTALGFAIIGYFAGRLFVAWDI